MMIPLRQQKYVLSTEYFCIRRNQPPPHSLFFFWQNINQGDISSNLGDTIVAPHPSGEGCNVVAKQSIIILQWEVLVTSGKHSFKKLKLKSQQVHPNARLFTTQRNYKNTQELHLRLHKPHLVQLDKDRISNACLEGLPGESLFSLKRAAQLKLAKLHLIKHQ